MSRRGRTTSASPSAMMAMKSRYRQQHGLMHYRCQIVRHNQVFMQRGVVFPPANWCRHLVYLYFVQSICVVYTTVCVAHHPQA